MAAKKSAASSAPKPTPEAKPAPTNTYKNRIVGHDLLDPRKVVPNVENWRKHPAHQQAAMDETLDTIGWIQDIIVNRQTGNLVDGHLRLALALKRKEATVPVKYVDLSPEEERRALATFDPLSSMAETDAAKLKALTEQLTVDTLAVENLTEQNTQAIDKVLDQLHFEATILDGGTHEESAALNILGEPAIDEAEIIRQETRSQEIPKCPHCERPLPPTSPILKKPYQAVVTAKPAAKPDIVIPPKSSPQADSASPSTAVPASTPKRSTRKTMSSPPKN